MAAAAEILPAVGKRAAALFAAVGLAHGAHAGEGEPVQVDELVARVSADSIRAHLEVLAHDTTAAPKP